MRRRHANRRRFRPAAIAWVVLLAIWAIGAGRAGAERTVAPITEEEARELAEGLERSFAGRDPAAFAAAFDDAAVLRRALEGYALNAPEAKEMAGGIKVGNDLANRIVKTVTDGGSYRLLRVETPKDAPPVPIFRLLARDSVNYHHLILGRDSAGAVRLVDVDIFISGEAISKTMRRLLVPALTEAQKGKADEVVKPLQDVAAMQRVAAGGDYKQALEMWDKLPDSLRKEKALQLTRLQYAQRVSPAKYEAAVADYERAFPVDPVLDLVRVSSLLSARKYDETLAAIDRLDRAVKDPYLDLLRGQVYAAKREPAKAQERFERVLKWDPTFERGWGGLLVIALNQKDWPKVVKLLDDRQRAVGHPLKPEQIEKAKEFGEFVKSTEYAKWKASRAK